MMSVFLLLFTRFVAASARRGSIILFGNQITLKRCCVPPLLRGILVELLLVLRGRSVEPPREVVVVGAQLSVLLYERTLQAIRPRRGGGVVALLRLIQRRERPRVQAARREMPARQRVELLRQRQVALARLLRGRRVHLRQRAVAVLYRRPSAESTSTTESWSPRCAAAAASTAARSASCSLALTLRLRACSAISSAACCLTTSAILSSCHVSALPISSRHCCSSPIAALSTTVASAMLLSLAAAAAASLCSAATPTPSTASIASPAAADAI